MPPGDSGFGLSVGASIQCGRVVSGAPYAGVGAGGAVIVFSCVRKDVFSFNCSQESILVGSDTSTGDQLGASVAITADGLMVFAGAPGWNNYAGTVYAWDCTVVSACRQVRQFTELSPTATDFFGEAIAISPTGSALVVSGFGFFNVFECEPLADSCILTAQCHDPRYGSVAVGASAAWVVVGAPSQGNGNGSILIFDCSSTTSCENGPVNELTAIDGSNFGYSVSIRADATVIVAGGSQRERTLLFSRSLSTAPPLCA